MKAKHGPVKQLLLTSSFWTLSKPLVYKLGLETAFLLCNFAEAENLSRDGWFYQTIKTVEEKTTLSRRKQDASIKQLEDMQIIETEVRGVPAKRYFKINYDILYNIMFDDTDKDVRNDQTSLYETDKLDCAKRTTNKELSNKETKDKEPNTLSGGPLTTKDKESIIERWNNLGLHQVRTINSGTNRYKGLKARIDEYSLDEVLEAIDNVKESSFLQGDNNRGWEITFDWLTRPNNFPKVLEGQYKDKEGTSKKEESNSSPYSRLPVY